ncbi:hypothetical protein [Xanthomonas phage NED111]|uniref:Uncharacterized protein n=1 Tax=Xanthomonas phage NED111 TaxID=2982921 RepID=A0AAX3EZP0_9CAUD|nr:hypothetical protein [Xanthomonas phage NED111]
MIRFYFAAGYSRNAMASHERAMAKHPPGAVSNLQWTGARWTYDIKLAAPTIH